MNRIRNIFKRSYILSVVKIGLILLIPILAFGFDWGESGSSGKATITADVVLPGHTLALKTDGTLWAWGQNYYGQLGTGNHGAEKWEGAGGHRGHGCSKLYWDGVRFVGYDIDYEPAPVQVLTATDWSAVSTSDDHTLALKADGALWTWGRNNYGQLGDGTLTDKYIPAQITGTNWAVVAAAKTYSLALKSDGTLWFWGKYWNEGGGESQRFVPMGVGTDIKAVSPPYALKTNGTLWYFGTDLTLTKVGTDTDWSAIAGSSSRKAALKTNGTLWTWGDDTVPPVQITGTNWSAVACSSYHTVALKSDGTLWAWGKNDSGQLGDGTLTDKYIPIQIGAELNWLVISTGGWHTLALKTDGTLWAWGGNIYGQLGDGTTTQRLIPTKIGTDTNWSKVYTD